MSRILLLEDETMIASGILYALETEGYETSHATGIKDARSLIEHYNFDLAIIDMQLPDGTGFDVSEILKNNGAWHNKYCINVNAVVVHVVFCVNGIHVVSPLNQ